MPADTRLGFAGFRAEPQVTRPLQRDTKLLQIERKDDGPLWAWTPAMLLVMGMNLDPRSPASASPPSASAGGSEGLSPQSGRGGRVIFAHIGHWATSIAFFAPVVVLPLGLFLAVRFSGRAPSGPASPE